MKPNQPNRHSERSGAESRNLFFNRPLKLFCLILLLTFITVGCKKRAAKPTEPADSLHKAVAGGDIDQIKSLISRGADVNAKDRSGRTPLHYAARWGHKDVAELLLAKDADVNVKDNQGQTPLSLAEEERHNEIVELLRNHGAKE